MGQKELIQKFYNAFQELDVETMISCYHDDIEFSDPGFGELKGEEVKNMWRMICGRAQNFSLIYTELTDNSVHWEAKYLFSKTGNKVHNLIDATFEFKEGKISKHTDVFDLHKWAGQALGLKGKLLGGTEFFKKKLQKQTRTLLRKFVEKK